MKCFLFDRGRAIVALTLLGFAGCSYPRSQLMIEVQCDAPLRALLTELDLELRTQSATESLGADGLGRVLYHATFPQNQLSDRPLQIPVVARAGAVGRLLLVQATAMDGLTVVARGSVSTGFVEGELRTVVIELGLGCNCRWNESCERSRDSAAETTWRCVQPVCEHCDAGLDALNDHGSPGSDVSMMDAPMTDAGADSGVEPSDSATSTDSLREPSTTAAGTWVRRTTAVRPGIGGSGAMVYDAERREIVYFGGRYETTYNRRTYIWDGSVWRNRNSSAAPDERAGHAMVYDPVRREVILFGGMNEGSRFGDTWAWDGSGWTRLSPANQPSARAFHSMVFDAARGETVMHGGEAGNVVYRDTWIWNGLNWTERRTNGPIVARHQMVYDEAQRETILFGGYVGNGVSDVTWLWNGTDWRVLAPETRPTPRSNFVMTYDYARDRIILFGGLSSSNPPLSDTWYWDRRSWQLDTPRAMPSSRYGHSCASDPVRREILLYGSEPFGDDTWTWR